MSHSFAILLPGHFTLIVILQSCGFYFSVALSHLIGPSVGLMCDCGISQFTYYLV